MKVFNLTDIETPQLAEQGAVNIPVVLGNLLLAPGASGVLTEDQYGCCAHAIRDYVGRGIMALEVLPPAYAVAKARKQGSKKK